MLAKFLNRNALSYPEDREMYLCVDNTYIA